MNFVTRAKKLQNDINAAATDGKFERAADCYEQMQELEGAIEKCLTEIRLMRAAGLQKITDELQVASRDVAFLRSPASFDDVYRALETTHQREAVPGIELPTVTVATADFVPDTPLYFVRETEEYAVRIAGQLFSGHVRAMDTGTAAVDCPNRRPHDAAKCKWNHGEAWNPASFIYTREPLNQKNVHMRHIGDRRRLAAEIESSTRRECAARVDQTMHDILVCLCIASARSK
jgi:uncharacterized protein YdbL (DUF1318 family)